MKSKISHEKVADKNGSGCGLERKYNPAISSEEEVIDFCKKIGGKAWFELAKWLRERNFLTPKARSQCFNMGKFLQKGKEPSVALSIPCKKAWEEAKIRGWEFEAQ